MRVDGLTSVLQQQLLAALPKAEASFRATISRIEPQQPVVPQPHASTTPATSVQMLIAMAATESTPERRREMAAKADRGLALLERLHRAQAAGAVPEEAVQELAAWTEEFIVPEDPQLATIAKEIELRVRVELAKHEIRA